jgi:hypothetical protein
MHAHSSLRTHAQTLPLGASSNIESRSWSFVFTKIANVYVCTPNVLLASRIICFVRTMITQKLLH